MTATRRSQTASLLTSWERTGFVHLRDRGPANRSAVQWRESAPADERTNLSTWMQWVTVTHTHRRHTRTHTAGEGPLYQGRFKSFPAQKDVHLLMVWRYVEANARRAKLVKRAEAWRWGSLWVRRTGKSALQHWLRPWPVDHPRNWLADVNRLMNDEVLHRVRQSVTQGVPLGDEPWKARVASRLGLHITLRPRGRLRKDTQRSSDAFSLSGEMAAWIVRQRANPKRC